MASEQSIQSLPKKAFDRAVASLGSAVPLGILLELSRSGNIGALIDKADDLVLRGSCRLRKLQASVPQIKIPEIKLVDGKRPIVAKNNTTKLKTHQELALALALIELYIGMLLRFFTSQKRANCTGNRLENQIYYYLSTDWIPSLTPPMNGIIKCPIPN
jgi:hypothetical protein